MGEEREIATFVILIKLTDQGASAIKDAPKHMQPPLAASGNVRTTSLRAFSPKESGAIVGRLGG